MLAPRLRWSLTAGIVCQCEAGVRAVPMVSGHHPTLLMHFDFQRNGDCQDGEPLVNLALTCLRCILCTSLCQAPLLIRSCDRGRTR